MCQYNEMMDEFGLQFDAEGVLLLKAAVEQGDVISLDARPTTFYPRCAETLVIGKSEGKNSATVDGTCVRIELADMAYHALPKNVAGMAQGAHSHILLDPIEGTIYGVLVLERI